MNTAAAPPVAAGQPSRPFGAKRIVLLVAGSLVSLLALLLVAAGAAAIWGLSERGESGYFTSGAHEFSTPSYAITSESLDMGSDMPRRFGERFATLRLETSSRERVFVGIGPAGQVERYLAGVQHDTVTDFETDPFVVDYKRVDGNRDPASPESQPFWQVQASGAGTQTITWPLEEGDWSVVAMNADRTRGVSVEARIGLRVSALGWLAFGLLTAGGVLLLVGSGLIYLGARRPRSLEALT